MGFFVIVVELSGMFSCCLTKALRSFVLRDTQAVLSAFCFLLSAYVIVFPAKSARGRLEEWHLD